MTSLYVCSLEILRVTTYCRGQGSKSSNHLEPICMSTAAWGSHQCTVCPRMTCVTLKLAPPYYTPRSRLGWQCVPLISNLHMEGPSNHGGCCCWGRGWNCGGDWGGGCCYCWAGATVSNMWLTLSIVETNDSSTSTLPAL